MLKGVALRLCVGHRSAALPLTRVLRGIWSPVSSWLSWWPAFEISQADGFHSRALATAPAVVAPNRVPRLDAASAVYAISSLSLLRRNVVSGWGRPVRPWSGNWQGCLFGRCLLVEVRQLGERLPLVLLNLSRYRVKGRVRNLGRGAWFDTVGEVDLAMNVPESVLGGAGRRCAGVRSGIIRLAKCSPPVHTTKVRL